MKTIILRWNNFFGQKYKGILGSMVAVIENNKRPPKIAPSSANQN